MADFTLATARDFIITRMANKTMTNGFIARAYSSGKIVVMAQMAMAPTSPVTRAAGGWDEIPNDGVA